MITLILMACLIYPAVLMIAMCALEFGDEPRWRDDQ